MGKPRPKDGPCDGVLGSTSSLGIMSRLRQFVRWLLGWRKGRSSGWHTLTPRNPRWYTKYGPLELPPDGKR